MDPTSSTSISRLAFAFPLPLVAAACQSVERSSGLAGLPEGYSGAPTTERPSDDRSVEDHLAHTILDSQVIDGRRVVDLDLQNLDSEPVTFAYNIEWYDRSGEVVVDREAAWTPLALGPGQGVPVRLEAPRPRADAWRLIAAALPGAGS